MKFDDISHTVSVSLSSSSSQKHTNTHWLVLMFWIIICLDINPTLFHKTEQISGSEMNVINTQTRFRWSHQTPSSCFPSAFCLLLLIKREHFKGQCERYTVWVFTIHVYDKKSDFKKKKVWLSVYKLRCWWHVAVF